MTELFNQDFRIYRNVPNNQYGINKDNYVNTGITLSGRISEPTHQERNIYQSRGLYLKAVIYCEPYIYDTQRDIIADSGNAVYKIQDITTTRDRTGVIHFLKLYVMEILEPISIESS